MFVEGIVLKPIGFVRHSYSDDYVRNSVRGVDGVVEILEEYRQGLHGLEGFSHVILLAYLHKVTEDQRKTLIVRPRGLARKLRIPENMLPEVGVFATDSPHRPNPIALTVARLIGVDVEKGVLYVDNIDLYSGTPVIDIKPYTPSRRVEDLRIPRWLQELYQLSSRRPAPVSGD